MLSKQEKITLSDENMYTSKHNLRKAGNLNLSHHGEIAQKEVKEEMNEEECLKD